MGRRRDVRSTALVLVTAELILASLFALAVTATGGQNPDRGRRLAESAVVPSAAALGPKASTLATAPPAQAEAGVPSASASTSESKTQGPPPALPTAAGSGPPPSALLSASPPGAPPPSPSPPPAPDSSSAGAPPTQALLKGGGREDEAPLEGGSKGGGKEEEGRRDGGSGSETLSKEKEAQAGAAGAGASASEKPKENEGIKEQGGEGKEGHAPGPSAGVVSDGGGSNGGGNEKAAQEEKKSSSVEGGKEGAADKKTEEEQRAEEKRKREEEKQKRLEEKKKREEEKKQREEEKRKREEEKQKREEEKQKREEEKQKREGEKRKREEERQKKEEEKKAEEERKREEEKLQQEAETKLKIKKMGTAEDEEKVAAEEQIRAAKDEPDDSNVLGGPHQPAPRSNDSLQYTVAPKEVTALKKRFPKFVFVYDIGTSYTTDLLQEPPRWWTDAYAGEEFLFHLLAEHDLARTTNPNKASLFYVPFFLSRFIALQRTAGRLSQEAIRKASGVFEKDIMGKVRGHFPWFNRTNGRDHFSIIAADHGRCSLLTFVKDPAVYGEMFFLQYNGDLAVRSNNIDERKQMHTLSYNPNRNKAKDIPELPCYAPLSDILMPPFVRPSLHIVAPSASKRDTRVLCRFGKYYAREEAQAVFFNRPIRIELYNLYADLQLPTWSFGPRNRTQTLYDTSHSVFCICPPGHSQWTSRTSIAIILGCIPVTFTREHDSAFQDTLNYRTFSVNTDPEGLPLLKRKLDRIARREKLLQQMQNSLALAQVAFSWDPVFLNGAVSRILNSLIARACNVTVERRYTLPCVTEHE